MPDEYVKKADLAKALNEMHYNIRARAYDRDHIQNEIDYTMGQFINVLASELGIELDPDPLEGRWRSASDS